MKILDVKIKVKTRIAESYGTIRIRSFSVTVVLNGYKQSITGKRLIPPTCAESHKLLTEFDVNSTWI